MRKKLFVKSPKPARWPAYTIETEAGEVVATVPITASGDSHKLALAMAAAPAMFEVLDFIMDPPEVPYANAAAYRERSEKARGMARAALEAGAKGFQR